MSQHGSDLEDVLATEPGHELLSSAGNTSHTTEPTDISARRPLKRFPLRRFYKRTISLIVAPIAITVYYWWVWHALLSRDFGGLKYSSQDESWIFYSWFIIGVFGLNLARYGLQGIEAAMLHERFWQVDNAMVLLMHSGSTWSGPSGWMKIFWLQFLRKKPIAQRLWFLLAFLSILAFVAMPLSGLTMEISEGYIKSRDPPRVVGRTWQDFERRGDLLLERHSASPWRAGGTLRLPGVGIAYTPRDTHRDQNFLGGFPNTLPQGPDEEGIAELFLAPQASTPVAGRTWGLLLGFNCSIVNSESEFTVLNKESSVWSAGKTATTPYVELRTEDMDSIYVFNSSGPLHAPSTSNVWAYGVIGSSWRGGYGDSSPRTDILEYVLWQVRLAYNKLENFEFNGTIDTPISGLGPLFIEEKNGTFSVNKIFPALKRRPQADLVYPDAWWVPYPILFSSAPIGVRCLSTSALGDADVDGLKFSSFNESPPYFEPRYQTRTSRFGQIAAKTLISPHLDLLRSINAPAPLADMGPNEMENYPQFVQAQMLLKAVLRAQAVNALQLMYDGIDSLDDAYTNVNLTSSKLGKVLERGVLSPCIVGVIYLIWAIACVFLACSYGFRRRWAETLDGYSFFRFGADFSDDIRSQPDFSSVESFDKCETLWRLPGLVGDSRPKMDVGHISLVRRENLAIKSKFYN